MNNNIPLYTLDLQAMSLPETVHLDSRHLKDGSDGIQNVKGGFLDSLDQAMPSLGPRTTRTRWTSIKDQLKNSGRYDQLIHSNSHSLGWLSKHNPITVVGNHSPGILGCYWKLHLHPSTCAPSDTNRLTHFTHGLFIITIQETLLTLLQASSLVHQTLLGTCTLEKLPFSKTLLLLHPVSPSRNLPRYHLAYTRGAPCASLTLACPKID